MDRIEYVDPLTGLGNYQRLVAELKKLVQEGTQFSLVLADIDRLKRFNQALGYSQGDKLLRTVAGLFAGQLRSGEIAVRLPEIDFIATLPGVSPEEEALREQAFRQALANGALGNDLPSQYRGATVVIVRAMQGEPWIETVDRGYAKMRDGKRELSR